MIAVPSVQTRHPLRARVAVGGSLNGKIVTVPERTTVVFAVPDGILILDDTPDGAFYCSPRMESYHIGDRGQVGLLICDTDFASSAVGADKLNKAIVEALGIAAGVHSPPRLLIDEAALREAMAEG